MWECQWVEERCGRRNTRSCLTRRGERRSSTNKLFSLVVCWNWNEVVKCISQISGDALAVFASFYSHLVFYVWTWHSFKCSNVFYIEAFKSIVNVTEAQIWDPTIRKIPSEQQSLATTRFPFDFTLVSVLTYGRMQIVMNSASRASFIQELAYRWSGMYIFGRFFCCWESDDNGYQTDSSCRHNSKFGFCVSYQQFAEYWNSSSCHQSLRSHRHGFVAFKYHLLV